MSTIAIGDVHGNLLALDDLLGQIGREAGDGDTVVFLGDYIDRGADTKGCVEAILRFQRESAAKVVCLCGNHEDWLLRTLRDFRRHSWLLGMEALDTIRSYAPGAADEIQDAMSRAGLQLFLGKCELPYGAFVDSLPGSHREFFENLPPCHEAPECLCSHGGLNPSLPDGRVQSRDDLLWGRAGFPDEYAGPRTVVYGHWNNAVLDDRKWPMPRRTGRTIGIDSISHGVLTAIRLPDERVFQSARYEGQRGR
jgi:serine/threonine protein phosphatase 1